MTVAVERKTTVTVRVPSVGGAIEYTFSEEQARAVCGALITAGYGTEEEQ